MPPENPILLELSAEISVGYMTLADLASFLGLLQGLILGVIIVVAHRPERPTGLLAAFIFTLTLRILPFLLLRSAYGAAHPWVMWLPLYFWYTSMPLLFLYTKQLTGRLRWHHDRIHLLPGALELLVFTGLLCWELSRPGPAF